MRIISGGQTGVDRAALDAALKYGIECGGWCPAGRLDEFGRIPDRYPLQELADGGFEERTFANIRNSQATVAIYHLNLAGGTEYAVERCIEESRPHLLIDAAKLPPREAANLMVDFVRQHKIDMLGVGGPRQSEWPGGYDYAFRVIEIFFTRYAAP